MGKFGIGNTFGAETVEWNNGQKRIWREIRHRFPSGGTFAAADITANAGKVIPAGTPVTFDQSAKTLTIVTGKESTAVESFDGFTQEDVYVKDSTTAATATVIYDGEIYEPVLKAAVLGGDATALAAVKKAAPKTIQFVQ
jgi:hypothetical protein